MRRTMFVLPTHLWPTLHSACTATYLDRELAVTARLVEEQGVAPDGYAWFDAVASDVLDVLAEHGPLAGAEVAKRVPLLAAKLSFGEGTKWAGTVGVSTRVLFLLAARGEIRRGRPRGSWLSSQYRWERAEPSGARIDAREARRELARRWLLAFGPATLTDLRWWTGWNAKPAREALSDAGALPVALEGDVGWMHPDDIAPVEPVADWAAFLPSLDSTTMGWKQRAWYLGDDAEDLFDRNGNAGPTVWWNGRVAGGWAQAANGEVVYRISGDAGSAATAAIAAEAERLTTWLDGTTVTPRFRSPLERQLAGGNR